MNTIAKPRPATRAAHAAHGCWQRGRASAAAGRWVEAESAFAEATRHADREALYWTNLAHARLKQDRFVEAADAARRAADLDRDDATALRILCQSLLAINRRAEAIEAIDRLDRLDAAGPALLTRRAEALCDAGRDCDAVDAAMRALALEPHHVAAHDALAQAFDQMGRPLEAVECLRTAMLLAPGDPDARLGALIHRSQKAARWQDLDRDVATLRRLVLDQRRPASDPFSWMNVTDRAAEQLQLNRQYVQANFGAIAPLPPIDPRSRAGRDRIHVGYLSNDFYQHATSLLLAEVLERHDRSRLHITLYSHSPSDDSALRRRIVAGADAFVEIGQISNAEAADRIRADGIDILVDLKGHTCGARTGILARRPAPIQVNWLGFPGSMGATFIDYLIGDPVVTPPQAAGFYDEHLALMPDCYQPNDRQRPIGPRPTRAECGLPEDGLVLACFNNSYKITPELFDAWCRLLHARPRAVLWLLEWNAASRESLLAQAGARGIDAARLVFGPFVDSRRNLGRLQLADLALDTYPVNGHTTTADALWAGVPVVTRRGEAFASRVAASLLAATGLQELAGDDLAAYERIALSLTAEPDRLDGLRARLRAARDAAALFDSERFATELGALYARMHERWQAGLPAARLPVERQVKTT